MSSDKKVEPIYDIEATLKFLEKTKNGDYAEIERSSLAHLRAHVDAQYVDVESQEYYHSYSC